MAKPSVAPALIRDWLHSQLGRVTNVRRLTEGEESQAFGFEHAGHAYVVRVNQELRGFAKDRFAAQRFRAAGLPIPEVLALGWLDGGHAACVTRRLPGTTLQDSRPETLRRLTGPVAAVLEAIAATDLTGTSGFGDFDELGRGRFSCWRDFLRAPLTWDWSAAAHPADPSALRELQAALVGSLGGCPERRRLVHGDFGSNNVLTDGVTITGVLDWAEAMFGDPLYDVANVLFWAPWLECMRIQAAYFETIVGDDANLWERLRCYQLRIGLGELFHHAAHGPDDHLAWLTDRTIAVAGT